MLRILRQVVQRLPGRPTLLLLGLVGFTPAALSAAEPSAASAAQDMRHTMLARAALLRDPVLAPLNLGVRVQNRVAILWGPVPSAELRQRAVQVLRRVPDFLDVRSELYLVEPKETVPQYLPDAAASPGSPREDDGWRGQFARQAAEIRQAASPSESVRLKPALPSTILPVVNDRGDNLVLPAVPAAPATVPLPAVEQAVRRQCAGDRRYRGLTAEVRGDRVRLTGDAASWADVNELAVALTRVDGIHRVDVEGIRIRSELP